MFDSEHNLESTKPTAKAAELPELDRLPAAKTPADKSDAVKNSSGGASLENLLTSSLYATAHPEASSSEQRSARDAQQAAVIQSKDKPVSGQPTKANEKAPQPPDIPPGNVFPASVHTMKNGETLEGLSRRLLGPKASEQDVIVYAQVVGQINGVTEPRLLRGGDKLDMPARDSKGAITFINPQNYDEHCAYNPDGSYEVHNVRTRTSSLQKPLDAYGSSQTEHKGPLPWDNYTQTFVHKDHYTLTTRQNPAGKTVSVGSDGFRKITDKNGNWVSDAPPNFDPGHASYDKASGVLTQQMSDGSVIKVFDSDKRSEATEPDGTKTIKFKDGGVKIEKKDAQGHDVGSYNHPDGKGGYTKHGWGPTPKDNYDETYSSHSGVTTRIEGKGTPDEKKTTTSPDGTVTVESKDGKNFRRNPDGSEHHWGAENYDKPAYDYKHNEAMNKARESLREAMRSHIPSGKQAAFRSDMANFETRARKENLPPDEIAKTYEQISRVLNATDQTAVVKANDRAMLAEGLMHQSAQPQDTDQGNHNTCNVTAALKLTLKSNPSAAAEMAATTAIKGSWTSPDGHTVKIDRESLQPQAEESTYPPHPGERSYATQVINLVMVNDALQRRPNPLRYVQRTPDGPDDTGERRLDAKNKVVTANQYDAKTDSWRVLPDDSPGLTDREVIESAKRFNSEAQMIVVSDTQAGVESVESEQGLADKLEQFKNQRKLPIILGVDGHHVPIQELGNESPSFGAHFVNIGNYDQKTGRVHVENQWGKQSNRWVSIKKLFDNASGNIASSRDGVDTADFQ